MLLPLPVAAQDALEPLKDFFTLQVRGGIQVFDYSEEFAPLGLESDYQNVAPAWGAAASLRFAERWRLNGEYLGSFVPEDTESWRFLGSRAQENDLEVDFHAFDVDVSYSIARLPKLEWAVALGWHYYLLDFERSNFRVFSPFLVAPPGPVTEEVRGQGVKVGTTLDARIGRRATLSTGVSGSYLYDVDVENSLLGRLSSEGWTARWRLGVDFLLTDNATIGVGYHGQYIRVDEASRGLVVLPENRTITHTLMLQLGVRF
ncbi:MAG TPA: hypothetical protein VNN07_16370 [Candidatus Tectomicrobia bacterium]|nr:hypothetical protein [Candidatus Tectomicrobia bacterium]